MGCVAPGLGIANLTARGRAQRLLAVTGVALSGISAGPALAAPAELDGSFGNGGHSLADFGGADTGQSLALQPDGRIVVAGDSDENETIDFGVVRLSAAGASDVSFGNGGYSLADFGGADAGLALALQPDGGIVVAGESYIQGAPFTYDDFGVVRLSSNGLSDGSFGNGGYSRADFGGENDRARDVALQPDGKIVVVGSSDKNDGYDFGVVRLSASGFSDHTFGDGGYSLADFGSPYDFGKAVALQPDGSIVVAGEINKNQADLDYDFGVVRLQANGLPDPSFGDGGYSRSDFGGDYDRASDVALQPDGKVIVAGISNKDGNDDFGVLRLSANGHLDVTFGTGGYSLVDFAGGDDFGQAMAVQPDGKIVVVGYSESNEIDDFAVVRLQPNGLPDTTFGQGGKVLLDFGVSDDEAYDVTVQPDGKIVVAGRSNKNGNYDFAVARLQGDPEPASGDDGGGTPPSPPAAPPAAPRGPPLCAGLPATIVGTPAADTLNGTPARDVIVALSGNDVINADGGDDLVCGDAGNDRLRGASGKDELYGGDGSDALNGGRSNDRLFGQRGKDTLVGGPGRRDVLRGGRGRDSQQQ